MEDYNEEIPASCFSPTILESVTDPIGFKVWTEKICYEKFQVFLPNDMIVDIRTWLNFNRDFNSGSYTQFLLNRYKETL